ncbi:MAG: hypothetical protein SFW67_04930 [Myxococcaceae bacterium]|nr:hypothetical protein [Myxococcaceae bacterium]
MTLAFLVLLSLSAGARPRFSASINGQPVSLTHAIGWTSGERAVTLLLSDRPQRCEAAPREGLLVQLVVAPLLLEREQNGFGWRRPTPETWRVTGATWPRGVGSDPTSKVTLAAPLQRGGSGEAQLSTKVHFLLRNEVSTLELSGAIAVQGCGARLDQGVELVQAPRVIVAGEPVEVRGATFRHDLDRPGAWRLELSSSPAVCQPRERPDVWVALRALPPTRAERNQLIQFDVGGKRVDGQVGQQRRLEHGLLPVPRPVDGGIEVEVALEFDSLGSVRGVVTAVDCSR